MAYITSWERRARSEGFAIGFAKGGKRILIRQLQAKFGDLPAWVGEKVEKADTSCHEVWYEAILSENNFDDVFATKPLQVCTLEPDSVSPEAPPRDLTSCFDQAPR